MAQYLVEAYMPERHSDDLRLLVTRAREAAAAMRKDGTVVRYLRPIVVPEDETCFHFLEAPSADAARELSRRADLVYERIVEALAWAGADPQKEDEQ
jgi:Protein of unknown function (DUF4242)